MIDMTYDNGREARDGFMYCASVDVLYYELAVISAQSLRDYHPDAHISLFTHANFVEERGRKIFDRIYTNIPIHIRSRMLCSANSPYQRTVFIDCDSTVHHRDIRKMHDHLDSCDLFYGANALHTVANWKWGWIDKQRKYEPKWHGSCYGWNKSDIMYDWMMTWYHEYLKQRQNPWPYEWAYREWQQFDMFTLWKMAHGRHGMFPEFERFKDLKIDILPIRWNCSYQITASDLKGPAVIRQVDKGSIKRMNSWWAIIEERMKDDTRRVKKRSPADPIIEYN